MAARELTAVVVMGGEVYGPGYINPPPEHIAKRITNPACWGEEEPDSGNPSPQQPAEPPATEPNGPAVPTEPDPTGPTPTEPDPAPADIPVPPRSGAGSGIDAWRAFATAKGVSYPANAKREDIIAACENAKVI